MKPFHLSFIVPSLDEARKFYVNLLGCEIGRDTGQWIDIIFFGHQLTMHQERDGFSAKPIDHFGPILEKSEWEKIAALFKESSVPFEMEPFVKAQDTENEAGKFIVKDPAGNLLEFKYYNSFAGTVVSKNP
ncbi:dioxygenase [bacterium SCSIO 12696]|nr:dioxygenase [bacterium SCSIO 12696]